MLGAVIVPDRHRYTLERRLMDLRRRLLREMQQHRYPILNAAEAGKDKTSRQRTERARLAAGGLPELHAAELWSGDQVFWMERDGTPALLERHRKWLRQVLSLVNEFEVTYRRNVLTVENQQRITTNPEVSIHDRIRPWLTPDISPVKVQKLQTDPYVRLFFGLVQSIEAVAQAEQWNYRIVCDRGKQNEMFNAFQTFDLLKTKGRWQRLESIEFQHSHENALIQLCDVVTYIDTKATYLAQGHKDKGPANQLRKRYFARARRHTPAPQGAIDEHGFFVLPGMAYAELMAMLTEMALLHCGGRVATLPERRKRLVEIMEHFPDVFMGTDQSWPRNP